MVNLLETKLDSFPLPGIFSPPRPGDFPIGSLQSRAAARALLDSRRPAKTVDEFALQDEFRKCATDPEYWLFTYCRSRDEHDPDCESKPCPDKEYLRELIRFWVRGRMILYEKSRQMMASWTLCSLYLWDAQFRMNRLNFIQSKKEEDSDRLVQRCFFTWQRQPNFIQQECRAEYSYCHLRFYKPGHMSGLPYSEIWGIPQGGSQIRQHTGSCLLIDEAAFQPDLEAAIGAAQPMLKGGGRLDVVSSAESGYFQELCEDRVQ
jgi:hypothetical protein